MELNKIRYFYTIAIEGSFTKAAQRLGIAQSSLSDAMLKLEYSLKTSLFIRNSKGVTLTTDGEILFHHARNIIVESENALASLNKQKNEIAGRIRILTTYGFASTSLFFHLIQFLKMYPDIQLTLICDDENLEIKTHEADISIKPYNSKHKNMHQTFLVSYKQHLYASPEYLEKNGIPKKADDLKNHYFILFNNPNTFLPYGEIEWALKIGQTKYDFPRKTNITVNSVECLYQAATEGLGIIALSEYSCFLQEKRLIPILPEVFSSQKKMYFVCPKELKNVQSIKVLENYLINAYKIT